MHFGISFCLRLASFGPDSNEQSWERDGDITYMLSFPLVVLYGNVRCVASTTISRCYVSTVATVEYKI